MLGHTERESRLPECFCKGAQKGFKLMEVASLWKWVWVYSALPTPRPHPPPTPAGWTGQGTKGVVRSPARWELLRGSLWSSQLWDYDCSCSELWHYLNKQMHVKYEPPNILDMQARLWCWVTHSATRKRHGVQCYHIVSCNRHLNSGTTVPGGEVLVRSRMKGFKFHPLSSLPLFL